MIEDSNTEISYSFRMSMDSDKYIDDFKILFSNHEIIIGKLFSDKSKPVVVLELDKNINLNILDEFMKNHKAEILSYDFFISMVTSYYEYIIDLPAYVIEGIRRFGGTVSFSYTFICMDED
ncbi:hypothetical protein [Candidatus Entotheonella palauensis]|uniref:Uncharacterized protein n=1 Tax=Candidatus Entotheonella gemina TaxID=1429439 RepID=W4M878_9BACT|nr:hypothetical protein [Candidatus Entotheonella palauensis]ETX05822.1 MAG: hypothetical protein ETSY2_20705 [Candidatus Entotheonella gemina]